MANHRNCNRDRNHISTQLLHLADDDNFRTVLYILLKDGKDLDNDGDGDRSTTGSSSSSNNKSLINLNKKTSGGDFLIHLLAYATCECATSTSTSTSTPSTTEPPEATAQLYALKCLKWVLDRDFTAVNKAAGDGGYPLHCSLAALAGDDGSLGNNDDNDDGSAFSVDDDDDDEDDANDEDDSEYEDDSDSDSDEENQVDKTFMKHVNEAAKSDTEMDDYCKEYEAFSSEEIKIAAIFLLLSYGEADTNIPLGNVHNLTSCEDGKEVVYNGDEEEGDDDEIELAYAKETVIQQWTPLMFAIQWLILSCTKCIDGISGADPECVEKRLSLPLSVIKLLIEYGADPTYMMAGIVDHDWNALHILSSANHIVSNIQINKDKILSDIKSTCSKISCVLALQNNNVDEQDIDANNYSNGSEVNEDSDKNDIEYRIGLYELFESIVSKSGISLKPIQNFAKALLTDDAFRAEAIVSKECSLQKKDMTDLLQSWTNTSFSAVLPTLQAVWKQPSVALADTTLFDMACSCLSKQFIKFICENGTMSDEVIRSGIISTFANLGSRWKLEEIDDNNMHELAQKHQQEGTINTILRYQEFISGKKQRILDRVLLESCSSDSMKFSPQSTSILLCLGADPNIISIAGEVMDNLTPLHVVAGNCRGTNGVDRVMALLDSNAGITAREESVVLKEIFKADLFAVTSATHQMPINIALEKKNFEVASELLQAMGEDAVQNTWWSSEEAALIGEVSITNASTIIFRQALAVIVASCRKEETLNMRELEKTVGKLLILAMDQRSGFGKTASVRNISRNLLDVIAEVSKLQQEESLTNLASWAVDEISGHNCLHLILRGDRGSELRRVLLAPVCDLILKSENGANFVSQYCASKFGGYTPLHLAYAIGCEESIKTLIKYGADTNARDSSEKRPKDLVSSNADTTEDILLALT